MSKELSVNFATPGANLYAVLRRLGDYFVWNGSALVAWVDADIANYDIPLTDQGGDEYAADMPAALPVGDYRAFYYERAGGTPAITDLFLKSEPFRWTGVLSAPAVGSSWYYSDRNGVRTVIDDANIAVVWDMDADGVEDAGLMVSDGQASDAYINLFLATEGIDVPIVLASASATVAASLRDVSNHMTVWYGWHHRGVQELAARMARPADVIAGMMSGYKTYADEQLDRLVTAIEQMSTTTETIAAMQAIVPTVEQAWAPSLVWPRGVI